MEIFRLSQKIRYPSKSVYRFSKVQEKKAIWNERNEFGEAIQEEVISDSAMEAAKAVTVLAEYKIGEIRLEYLLSNGPGDASPLEEKLFCGYFNTWKQLWSMRGNIPFDKNLLERLTENLFSFMDDPSGTVHFRKPSDAKDRFLPDLEDPSGLPRIEEKLSELMAQTDNRLNAGEHPLVIIPLFLAGFFHLRPYSDFNLYISMLLTHFLMLHCEYYGILVLPLEKIFAFNSNRFKVALGHGCQVAAGLHESPEQLLKFFLKTVDKSLDHGLETKVAQLPKAEEMHPLEKQVIQLLKETENLKIAQMLESTGANRSTLKVHLKKLCEGGYIVQHGQRKGSFYSLP